MPGTQAIIPVEGSRTLALTAVAGVAVPAVYYHSPDGVFYVRVDSGTATIQSDSVVVLREYVGTVYATYPPSPTAAPGSSQLLSSVGRLVVSGDAILAYTHGDAAPDTAKLGNGGTLTVRIRDFATPASPAFADWTYSPSYKGATLNPFPTIHDFVITLPLPQNREPFTLTINGSGFVPATKIEWYSGTTLPTTYVSSRQITTRVPGPYLYSADPTTVAVTNPGPGGGSVRTPVTIVNRVPHAFMVTPSSVTTGSSLAFITIEGSGFNSYSVVQVNGAARTSTLQSDRYIRALLPASDFTAMGTLRITVFTPPLGGGLSESLPFTVASVAPK